MLAQSPEGVTRELTKVWKEAVPQSRVPRGFSLVMLHKNKGVSS